MKIKVFIGVIGSGKDYQCSKECDKKMAFDDKIREDTWKLVNWIPKNEIE